MSTMTAEQLERLVHTVTASQEAPAAKAAMLVGLADQIVAARAAAAMAMARPPITYRENANPVGHEQYFTRTAAHIFGSEAIGRVNGVEQLALALTMIELGDDVVDFGTTARILKKPTLENKNLFNLAMANHLEGSGYTCREEKTAYGKAKRSKMFHNLLQLQQQLQLCKR
jgi:hypothetical protein